MFCSPSLKTGQFPPYVLPKLGDIVKFAFIGGNSGNDRPPHNHQVTVSPGCCRTRRRPDSKLAVTRIHQPSGVVLAEGWCKQVLCNGMLTSSNQNDRLEKLFKYEIQTNTVKSRALDTMRYQNAKYSSL